MAIWPSLLMTPPLGTPRRCIGNSIIQLYFQDISEEDEEDDEVSFEKSSEPDQVHHEPAVADLVQEREVVYEPAPTPTIPRNMTKHFSSHLLFMFNLFYSKAQMPIQSGSENRHLNNILFVLFRCHLNTRLFCAVIKSF